MERLRIHARALMEDEKAVVLAGDYNVIPDPPTRPIRRRWRSDALFLLGTRAAFRAILAEGYTDGLRACDPRDGLYTFWGLPGGLLAAECRHPHRSPAALTARRRPPGLGAPCRSTCAAWTSRSDHVPLTVELTAG